MAFKTTVKIDQDVLSAVRSGDNYLYEKIYADYVAYIKTAAARYSFSQHDYEEKFAVGNVGFVMAVNTFDPTRGVKFMTYAYNLINHAILNHMRYERKHTGRDYVLISMHDSITLKDNEVMPEEIIADKSADLEEIVLGNLRAEKIQHMIKYLIAPLPEHSKKVILMMLGEHTQQYIADTLGISQSTVYRIEQKFKSKLAYELGRCEAV